MMRTSMHRSRVEYNPCVRKQLEGRNEERRLAMPMKGKEPLAI